MGVPSSCGLVGAEFMVLERCINMLPWYQRLIFRVFGAVVLVARFFLAIIFIAIAKPFAPARRG
jgi:hypothetical protein